MKQHEAILVVATLVLGMISCNEKTISSSTRLITHNSTNSMNNLICKLTTLELQERKQRVLSHIKAGIIDRKELQDGYAFRFPGSDEMIIELSEFIITERACCPFFTFRLSVSDNQSDIWLELSGPEGAKYFIVSELEL